MKNITLIAIITFVVIAGFLWIFRPSPNPTDSTGTPQQTTSTSTTNTANTTSTTASNTTTKTTGSSNSTQSNTRRSGMTMSDVRMHSSSNSCYLVINNNVYDVTSYIYSHPGGSGNIISRCGTEVTGIFASIHSNWAWDLLANYKIGTLN